LQFQFIATRAAKCKGSVAVDDVKFEYFENCPFTPSNAKPTTTVPPPTTTKAPTTVPKSTTKAPTTLLTTTVEPTEPPDCTI
jgi:hypothetical protein